MKIKTKDKTITSSGEVREFLKAHGLHAECYEPGRKNQPYDDELLEYEEQMGRLKGKFGYIHADVVSLKPDTPNLDQVLGAFVKEHHHTDDEVRFVVEGRGIFYINPIQEPVFEVHVEAGDLLIIPAFTRHWFNLKEDKSIQCIRVFKENPQWEAIYEMPKVAFSYLEKVL